MTSKQISGDLTGLVGNFKATSYNNAQNQAE